MTHLTQSEGEKLTNKLAMQAADSSIKAFLVKILKAIKAKGLTLPKLLDIYSIIEKAIKDIESVIAQK